MQHLFVPQELALKLKEKGFNEPSEYGKKVGMKMKIQEIKKALEIED